MNDKKRGVPGITVVVPGRKQSLSIDHVVLDFNGTLAVDGRLIRGVATRLRKLAGFVNVIVLTADTFGSARRALAGFPLDVRIVRNGQEKRRLVESIGAVHVTAIGNGVNDIPMCKVAAFSIAVMGREGASCELLRVATVAVHGINDALDLFLKTQRLVATLRR